MASCETERGDVILFGLLRMVAGLLAIGLLLFDGGAVMVNHMQLDEAARRAAVAGASTWKGERSRHAVEVVVRRRLSDQTGMTLEEVAVDGARVAVTVSRPARVLLLDRFRPLASWAQGRATSTSAVRLS